jgi:hypothetical protein
VKRPKIGLKKQGSGFAVKHCIGLGVKSSARRLEKVWDIGVYGLSQAWVMRVSTVLSLSKIGDISYCAEFIRIIPIQFFVHKAMYSESNQLRYLSFGTAFTPFYSLVGLAFRSNLLITVYTRWYHVYGPDSFDRLLVHSLCELCGSNFKDLLSESESSYSI